MRIVIIAPRVIVGAAGLGIGQFCLRGAYDNGYEFSGLIGGICFAGVVVAVWFLPSVARTTTLAMKAVAWACWCAGTAWVLINAIEYSAKHRTEIVGTRQRSIDAYDRATADRARLTADLERVRADPRKPGADHPRWIATAGCSNATVPESAAYCSEAQRIRRDLDALRPTLDAGRPLAADPGAESLRRVLGMSPADIHGWWPIWTALVAEIIATACITLAFAPVACRQADLPTPEKTVTTEPIAEPEPAAEPEPSWLSREPMQKHYLPKYTDVVPLGRLDGRRLRHMPKSARNENAA